MFGFPYETILKAAGCLLIFMLGLALGNIWATEREVARVQAHDDAQFAQATNAMAQETKRRNAAAAADAAMATAADTAAHETLTQDRDAALGARDAALAQLEREHKSKMEIVDAYTKAMAVKFRRHNDSSLVSSCGYSGVSRRLLDDAAGAVDHSASAGIAEADPAGRAPAAHAAPAGAAKDPDWLSCDDLYRGYVALGHWAREQAIPRVKAWEDWYRKRFAQP